MEANLTIRHGRQNPLRLAEMLDSMIHLQRQNFLGSDPSVAKRRRGRFSAAVTWKLHSELLGRALEG